MGLGGLAVDHKMLAIMVGRLRTFLHSNRLKRLKILKIILDKLTSFQLLEF